MANKVLFITQEIIPYVDESEMSAAGRKLPQAIQEKGEKSEPSCRSGEM